MTVLKRLASVVLCAAIFLSGLVPVLAATVTTTVYSTEKLYTAKETFNLPMWHYSGKYWKIGSGSSARKVSDAEIEQDNGLAGYLAAAYPSVSFRITLPDKVKNARDAGDKIRVAYEGRGNAAMNDIFVRDSIQVITDVSDGKDYFEFSIVPKFNLVKNRDFTDFVSGLSRSIPLISYQYGQNVYSLFGNGANAVQGNGWYNGSAPSAVTVPYIHPSFIRDKSGTLDDGYVISVGGKTVSSGGYSAGNGTFANAGACGINFVFPINVVFSRTTATQVITETEDKPVETENTGNQPDKDPESAQVPDADVRPGSGTEPQPGAEPVPVPEAEPDVTDIRAVLSLPEEAYEGQIVTAEDNSTFDFNGSYYGASGAYKNGIASNNFDYPGAKRNSRAKTSVDISYPEAGTYCVTLRVSATSGETGSDSKAISILPCPAVSAAIGGKQLQNRKQSLKVFVQQNPEYPVKELLIRISEPVSGESISISRRFSGAQAAPSNTEHIKYRSLFDIGSDENCIASEVDFLSKFSDSRTFRYEVTATDSKGRKATDEGSFLVKRDTPPQVKIGIAQRYYREKDSDTAVILLTDESFGSGNFQREWSFEGSSFRDLSSGTGKTVSFERSGVGEFTVGLRVKDLWTDETLEEYVSDSDHLCAEASASSLVDNIAPVVSLEMKSAQKKELLLLASDRDTLAEIESSIPSLKAELAGRGINAVIHADLRLSAGISRTGSLKFVRQISTPTSDIPDTSSIYYSHMDSDFWNCGHVSADDSTVYSMDSSSFVKTGSKGKYVIRSYPFYIKAFDSRTGSEKWSFAVSEEIFKSDNSFETALLGHDEQNKYLYLISNGKTLLLDKNSGAYVRMINAEFGAFNFVHDENIFTFKSDGIYKYDNAGMSRIYSAQISAGINRFRTVGGKVRFCEMKNGSMYISCFDPSSASVSSVRLEGTDSQSTCMAIDTRGNVLIRQNAYSFTVYTAAGKKSGSTVLDSSVNSSVPSFDGSGRVNYVAGSFRKRTGKSDNRKYYNYMYVGALYSPYTDSNYTKNKGDYRSFSDVVCAFECGDGTVATLLPSVVAVGDSLPLYSMTEYNFSTAGGSNTSGILVSGGMPPTDYVGWFEGGTSILMYNSVYNNVAMVENISESESDETERLKTKWLADPNGICITVNGSIDADAIMEAIGGKADDATAPARVYKVNEAIDYNIYYSDYEGDPSAASFWQYTHEPGSDGLWEKSGKILNAPVTSFPKEGRYTLLHWQRDNAGRGLVSGYDKESNRCKMVFYIQGTDEGGAPEITGITTDPQKIYVGGSCDAVISVTDPDGDSLSVVAEVYHASDSDPVKTWSGEISPSGGNYPAVRVSGIPLAEAGGYEIVVSASDGISTDIESAYFTPDIAGTLSAGVNHTESWESNRQSFNQKNFGNTYAETVSEPSVYRSSGSPRSRGRNVFWPGEKLMLRAELTGEVISVTAQIQGYPYSTMLQDAGGGVFTGTLYDHAMKTVFDTGSPLPVTVRFTAEYKNSAPLTCDTVIIFDQDTGYWALHRTQ